MSYVYDDATGRVTAVFLEGTPVPPSGFSISGDAIENEDVVSKKRDIGSGTLIARDGLRLSGTGALRAGTVGQLAIQKFDGTTLDDKTASGDNEALKYKLESEEAFADRSSGALVDGAASLKVAAPVTPGSARFLAQNPDLQILDAIVEFV